MNVRALFVAASDIGKNPARAIYFSRGSHRNRHRDASSTRGVYDSNTHVGVRDVRRGHRDLD